MSGPYDLVAVGAGPAGAAAAITAARAGLRVLVVDKASDGRDKCCGDGLTALALSELDRLGVPTVSITQTTTVDAVTLRAPSGRLLNLELNRGRPLCATAPRRDFDAALVAHARSAGAEVWFDISVEAVALLTDGSCRLRLAGATEREVVATHVVAADGNYSNVRRLLGLRARPFLGDWHATRQYVQTDTGRNAAAGAHAPNSSSSHARNNAPNGRPSHMHVWFEPDLLPGYAWSFPLADGKVNVGFGVRRTQSLSGKQLAETWAGLLERPHIREVLGEPEPLEPAKAWPIPTSFGQAPLTAGGVMFVGDAAAAADPLTGEGIGQALLTGRLAATAATEAVKQRRSPLAAARQYRREARAELAADAGFNRALSALLAQRPVADGALRAMGAGSWMRRRTADFMFEAYPRALLATPRRWRDHVPPTTRAARQRGAILAPNGSTGNAVRP